MPQYVIRPFWLAAALLLILLTGCASAPGGAAMDGPGSTQSEPDHGEGGSGGY